MPCDLLDNGSNLLRELGCKLGKRLCDGWHESTLSIARLKKVFRSKGPLRKLIKDKSIHTRTNRFHHIQRKRVSCSEIRMHHPHAGIESHGQTGNPYFRLEN